MFRTSCLLVVGLLLVVACAPKSQTVRTAGEPVGQTPPPAQPVAPPAARPAEPVPPAAPAEPGTPPQPPRGALTLPTPIEYPAQPGRVTEPVPGGVIDWGGRVVRATGSGVADPAITNPAQARLMAERAAAVNCQRNLLEIVKGVRINSDTKVENFMTRYDVVNSSISGMVVGARQVGPAQWDSVRGLAQVEMEMNLVGPGSLSDAMAPVLDTAGAGVQALMTPEVQEFFRQYSALVVEARDSTLKPALFPRIYDEDGNLLVDTEQFFQGTGKVGRYAVQYVRRLDEVLSRPEFAQQPLVVRLRQISGRLGADIVLSRQDAGRLQWLKTGAKFLVEAGRLLVKLIL
jgi:hypothetical protein